MTIPAQRYDYFLAVPMSSLARDEYELFREELRALCKYFKDHNKTVFCAPFTGEEANFNQSAVAYTMDTEALRQSDCFIWIVPRAVHSGAIYEAGYADALGIPSIWFVKNRKDLVYMCQETDQRNANVIIEAYNQFSDIFTALDALNSLGHAAYKAKG